MRIRVSNPALIGDLVAYLVRRNDCEAVPMGRDLVAVSLSPALPYETARLELDFQLAEWRLGHADASAIVID